MKMKLGYADESGEPGIEKNDNDYFVFCIVVVDNKEASERLVTKIRRFRQNNGLPDDYEFHHVKNPKRVREAFTVFIGKLDFEFVSVSIKKNNMRRFASANKMSQLVLDILKRNNLSISIEMDKNPILYKELRKNKKERDVVLHCREKESRGNDLIQLADYVTSIRARYLKHGRRTPVKNSYGRISSKLIDEIKL